MKKIFIILYGFSILGISYYGLTNHIFYIQQLMNLSKPYMFFRVILFTLLLTYGFIPQLRLYITKNLIGVLGFAMLFLGSMAMFSPSLFGHLNTWFLFGDALTLIEGGILAIVLSAELSIRRTNIAPRVWFKEHGLLSMQHRKLEYPFVNSKSLGTIIINQLLDVDKRIVNFEPSVRLNTTLNKVAH